MRIGAQLVILGLTVLTTTCASRRPPPPATSAAGAGMRDTHELLDGVLWMQTAAEFWALSQSAFDRATQTLDRALADKNWTAALEQESVPSLPALPPAVVMDVDETVLDNSQFQGQLVLDRTDFVPQTWTAWVEQASAPEIPGAIDFINANPNEARKQLAKNTFTPDAVVDTVPLVKFTNIKDLTAKDKADFQKFIDFSTSSGTLPEKVDVTKYLYRF